ncbi:MAG: ribosome assembly RNA-binding protein YhbY [Spirochaetales bacterium]|nr:ribosome assembly RNA-binding protein YhbY [Spirochaetales bacterium]
MKELTSQQRKYLTKEAHDLNPVVMVGQKGVTEGLLTMVRESLENHELIKVKFVDYKESRREISDEIAQKCDACLIRVVGNIAILYRPQDDPAKRRYKA